MSELLLELFYEEIPSLMQIAAEGGYREIFIKYFQTNQIKYKNLEVFSTPRRITIHVSGLDKVIAHTSQEFKGPKVDSIDRAIEGFCKSHNVNKEDLTIKQIAGQKYYFYIKHISEQLVSDLLKIDLPFLINEYSWAKSMYWGNYNIMAIRPLRNIICLFDNKTLALQYGHLTANNITHGHRFIGEQNIIINSFADYKKALMKNYVILDRAERKEIINSKIEKFLLEHNLTINEDIALVNEIAGLVEWPIVMIGKIKEKFIKLPKEILVTTMRTHQKYFSLFDSVGNFSRYFLFVSNLESPNPEIIIEGNERVLEARLSDALYFYELDRKSSLESFLPKLEKMNFHAKLGNMKQKVNRIKNICIYLEQESIVDIDNIKRLVQESTDRGKLLMMDLDPDEVTRFVDGNSMKEELVIEATLARRSKVRSINYYNLQIAANLCKYDLVSAVVKELPELQGIMGYYYALEDLEIMGYNKDIAEAIKYHYNPQGPKTPVPIGTAGMLALADKFDNLVGLMLAGEVPSGSKDPFGLRRLALGIIRIILENNFSIDLIKLIKFIIKEYSLTSDIGEEDIVYFMEERVKNYFKNEYDGNIIAAVLSLKNEPDLIVIKDKLEKLKIFLITHKDANAVIDAYKRINNILPLNFHFTEINKEMFVHEKEKELYNYLIAATIVINQITLEKSFKDGLIALPLLAYSINDFFDNVMINDKNVELANNRLALLYNVKLLFNRVVNFDML